MSTTTLGPIETTTVNAVGMGEQQIASVGLSPWTLINGCSTRIVVMISGGTVSAIDLSLDGNTFISGGLLGGQYILAPSGQLRITYAILPTVNWWPI